MTAKTAAETAQTAAETARDDAVADAAAELKIAGTVKSVGANSIDAAASSSVVTTDGDDGGHRSAVKRSASQADGRHDHGGRR